MTRFPANNSPYYDDFNEDKHFIKVLYKPGVAVQARELNQTQSIIQNQVERFGKHIFEDGSQVVPGNITIDYKVAFINVLKSTAISMGSSTEIEAGWIGKKITCTTSSSLSKGVKALVFDYAIPSETLPDTVTLFVKYLASNSIEENITATSGASVTTKTIQLTGTISSNYPNYANGYAKFSAGSTTFFRRITAYDNSSKILTLDSNWSVTAIDAGTLTVYPTNSGGINTFSDFDTIQLVDDAATTGRILSSGGTGLATTASIKKGIYFTHGAFCQVEDQIIVIDPDTITPNCRVGLTVTESVISASDDSSLYDNSLGTTNTAAPGADRLAIDLVLAKLDLDTIGTIDEENFIELVRIENGIITKKVDNSNYSIINKTLARRTYDESGDYTVKYFHLDIQNFFDESTTGGTGEINSGVFELSDFDYDTQEAAENASLVIFERKNSITNEPEAAAYAAGSKFRPGIDQNELLSLCRSRMAVVLDPGKAYVKGFEIEKISKSYLSIPKALKYKFSQSTLNCAIGNYVKVSNVYGCPNVASHASVTLYSDYNPTAGTVATTAIGTANVAAFEYDSGTVGQKSAVYKLFLFNIQMTGSNSFENVKSVASTNTITFTADLFNDNIVMTGTISHAAGTSVTGVGTTWLTNPDVTQRLYVGDVLVFDSSSGKQELVISGITSDTVAISVTSSGVASTTAFTKKINKTRTINPGISYVYEVPDRVKTLKDEYGHLQTEYTARMHFRNISVTSGVAAITLLSNSQFTDFSPTNYTAFVTQYDGAGTLLLGQATDLTNIVSVANNGQTLRLDFSTGVLTSGRVDVYANVLKKGYTGYGSFPAFGSQYKTKSVQQAFVTTALNDKGIGTIQLGKCDIKQIDGIYMASSFSVTADTTGTNITDRYTLDDGQRDTHYAPGKITLKPSVGFPTGSLYVAFKYYTHTTSGNETNNYFCVDSTNADQEFSSKESGWTYELNDCLDFRPTMADDGLSFVTPTQMPVGNVQTIYAYYLNRIDKIYLDVDGTFRIVKGVDAEFPEPPDSPQNGMTLYELKVAAKTPTPSEVYPEFVENKRYTMRDIGRIEKRIDDIEYYTNLNQLEAETANMKITDADGFDRYKNGFVAENFSQGSVLADTENPDLKCSFDYNVADCSAQTTSNAVGLIEKAGQTDLLRSAAGYQLTGNLITLPYDEVNMLEQPLASHAISVNPFNTITFYGIVKLTPDNDIWKDTDRAPVLTIQDTGAYDSVNSSVFAQGTIYGDWQNNGNPVITSKKLPATKATVGFGNNAPDKHHKTKWPKYVGTFTNSTKISTQSTVRIKRTPVVTATFNMQSLGDKVINVSLIPYMRSVLLSFSAKGLMPGVKVTPFFDDVNVEHFCYGTNFIPDSSGSLTGYFVVPGALVAANPASFGLPVSVLASDAGSQLTDADKAIRIKVGTRQFVLTDNSQNTTPWKSKAQTTFFAQGTKDTLQETVLSTKAAQVSYQDTLEYSSISTTVSNKSTLTEVCARDPLAESFLVTQPGGAFLTSIELYFSAKDSSLPVSIEIRNTTEDGYPGKIVVPYSQVYLDASSVTTSSDASVATKFTFESPVYLMENENYCFVVMSNSDAYECWIATAGLNPGTGLNYTQVGTDIPISKNPYTGSFFRSENANTWVADSTATDLKFKINCAKFNKTSGVVELTNDVLDSRLLQANPIQTTAGSCCIRVLHPNHGMSNDILTPRPSYVTISGVSSNVNGISFTQINGTHVIENVDQDSYSINLETEFPSSSSTPFVVHSNTIGASASVTAIILTGGSSTANYYQGNSVLITSGNGINQVRVINSYTGTTKTAYVDAFTTSVTQGDTFKVYPCSSGYGGGNQVLATENHQMDVFRPMISQLVFPDAAIDWFAKITTSKSVDGSEQPYVLESYVPVLVNTDNVLDDTHCVASSVIEQSTSMFVGGVASKQKSFWMKANLFSSNQNISPVIDLSEMNLITAGHRVDYPTVANRAVLGLDQFEIMEIPTYGWAFDPANSRIALPGWQAGYYNGTVGGVMPSVTQVLLATTASSVTNAYVGLNINLSAGSFTERLITAYSGPTQIATVTPAFPSVTNLTNYTLGISTAQEPLINAIKAGDTIYTSGASYSTNNKVYTVSSVSMSGITNCKQVYIYVKTAPSATSQAGAARAYRLTKFVAEDAPKNNSAASRYIMKRFTLDSPSTALKITVAANRFVGSDIKTYYRIQKEGANVIFDDLPWTEAQLTDSTGLTISEVTPATSSNQFKDHEYVVNGLAPFTVVQVKVVMLGNDSANPPILKDVRVIALDL